MLYPIISTSLITQDKLNVYQGNSRKVSLVYYMDAEYLLMMSARDSGICKHSNMVSLFEFSLSANLEPVNFTYGFNDNYKLFYDYYASLLESLQMYPYDPGEILFNSKIQPDAVLIHEGATDIARSWAKSYANVYALPMYKIDRDMEGVFVQRCD